MRKNVPGRLSEIIEAWRLDPPAEKEIRDLLAEHFKEKEGAAERDEEKPGAADWNN